MAYQTYSGAWLAQTNTSYQWLANERQQITPQAGADTAKIWQSYTLAGQSPLNNLIVFGDGNYAAGNAAHNVLIAENARVTLYGGLGEDVFVGSGGSGTTFVIAQGEGHKAIQNFTGADTVRLIGGPLTSFEAVKGAMTQQGADVVLNDGGTMITFRNTSIGQFQADDFALPLNYGALGNPVFADEFNSAATIGATWRTNYGFAGEGRNSFTLPNNGEQQIYTSAGFKGTSGGSLGLNPYSFDNGVLTIKAAPVDDWQASQMWGYRYSSGMLLSEHAQTYGYFEMRAELPKGQGLWPAFWLMGEGAREIDVLEGLGSDTKVAYNALHSQALPALGNASFNPYADGFHTYGVMWAPDVITFYVDGSPVWKTQTPWDQNQPLKMVVNLAVGGNWPGSPDASTPWPAEMKVDYVRTYNLPQAGATPPVVTPPVVTPPVVTPPPPPPSAPDSGQTLTSPTTGATLVGGSGADTLIASQSADRLTGGAGADTFAFKALPWNGHVITDFQAGVDKLSFAGLYTNGYTGSTPIADGYVTLSADGAGGTRVMLDTDAGGASWINFHVVTLAGVGPAGLNDASLFGGSASAPASAAPPTADPAPAPPAATQGVTLTSTTINAVLTGGAADDTLVAGQSGDKLTGGGGADSFVFKLLPWNGHAVTDFTPGTDHLDFRPLFAAAGYRGSDPLADAYLRFDADGHGGTRVFFDPDGHGQANPWPVFMTALDGVSPQSLHSGDWLWA